MDTIEGHLKFCAMFEPLDLTCQVKLWGSFESLSRKHCQGHEMWRVWGHSLVLTSRSYAFFRGCLRQLIQPPVISVGFVDNEHVVVVSPAPNQRWMRPGDASPSLTPWYSCPEDSQALAQEASNPGLCRPESHWPPEMTVSEPGDSWITLYLALVRLSGKPMTRHFQVLAIVMILENWTHLGTQGPASPQFILFLHKQVGGYSTTSLSLGTLQSVSWPLMFTLLMVD